MRGRGSLLRGRALVLPLLLLSGMSGCDRGDEEPAAEREAAVEAPDEPYVAPDVPESEGFEAVLPEEELGSIEAEDVVRASAWTTAQMDRGDRGDVPISEGAEDVPTGEEPAGRTSGDTAASAPPANAVLDDIGIAEGNNFDRVVFEFSHEGELPPYHLSFVDTPLTECGSGQTVTPGGEAFLFVQLLGTRAHEETGESTIVRDVRAPGLPNLKEIHLLCDFEGVVEWVLAVAQDRPFRVIEAHSPRRLVVDIQH